MNYFARINDNGVVTEVICASLSFIQNLEDKENWIETDTTGKFRNIFAGIGHSYDKDRDIFLPPKPYPSWVEKKIEITGLDENNNIAIIRTYIGWAAPIPKPNNKNIFYKWDEDIKNWVIVQPPSLSGAN